MFSFILMSENDEVVDEMVKGNSVTDKKITIISLFECLADKVFSNLVFWKPTARIWLLGLEFLKSSYKDFIAHLKTKQNP